MKEESKVESVVESQTSTESQVSENEEYESNIMKATFGEAIWATGGLEKFFAGLISVGETVTARKVGRAKR